MKLRIIGIIIGFAFILAGLVLSILFQSAPTVIDTAVIKTNGPGACMVLGAAIALLCYRMDILDKFIGGKNNGPTIPGA